jgi:RNA polymerase sigma-70 factor (ECF subfamily)
VISRGRANRYNRRGVKFSAQIDAVMPEPVGAEPPGFSACFQAFDDEFDYVCRALRRLGVGAGDAEDVAQEVLMVVWRRWRDFDRRRPLRPWLAGIAARVARDFLRRRWREIPHSQLELVDPALIGEEQVEASRVRGLALFTLASLPDRHRLPIVLHDLQGLAPHQIARALAIPLATAYTRLRRAHLAFAREMARARKRQLTAMPLRH